MSAMVGLLRFDQTDGEIVPNGMKPEWDYPCLLAKPLQHQLHRGLPHGVLGQSNRINEHIAHIAVTSLCSSKIACSLSEGGTELAALATSYGFRGGASPFYGQIFDRLTVHFSANAAAQNAYPQHQSRCGNMEPRWALFHSLAQSRNFCALMGRAMP